MDFWIGVGILAIGVMVSIALHEVGHMVPAKAFGVKVTQYFVGFGKTLWSTKRGETEYGIKMLPLGGFVRMIGMFPPGKNTPVADDREPAADAREPAAVVVRDQSGTTDAAGQPVAADADAAPRRGIRAWMDRAADDARAYSAGEVPPGQEHRAFYSLSVPKKLTVMFGGPAVNLIIAAVLIAIVLTTIGQLTATNRLASVSQCVLPAGEQRECTADDVAAPAAEAGLQPGDVIVEWDGTPASDWEDVSAAIAAGGTDPVPVIVERDGQRLTLTVTAVLTDRPTFDDDGRVITGEDGEPVTQQVPFVGIGPTGELVKQPISAVPVVVWDVFSRTVQIVVTLPQRLVGIANSLFGDAERDPNVVGLIGVGRFAGEIASADIDDFGMTERTQYMLLLLASLNMALFVFNMIPLLPLDGGHIAGAVYEGARRRIAALMGRADPGPVDTARLMPLTYVVVFFMLSMTLLLAAADILNPISLL